MRYEFWLGCRYLFAKRRERFISVIAVLSIGGVALGVAALIVVLAVMTGFDHDITDKLINTNAHLIVDSPAGIADSDEVMRKLSAMEHVIGVSPFVSGQAILRMPDRAFGVLLRGIDVDRESRVNRLGQYLVFGMMPKADDEVIAGNELAAYLRVSPGDKIELISPADGKTRPFKVCGIFRSGMYEYDSTLMATTLASAQQFYKLSGTVTGIGVKLDQLDKAPAIASSIENKLGGLYQAKTWMELNPALFGALRVEKTVMFIILSLIIVVAALNIMSMLIMIVMEKTKDIGTLRALGSTRLSIAMLFLSQGFVIGLIGVGLGLAGGLTLAWRLNDVMNWIESLTGWSLFPPSIYYLDHIPTLINAGDVASVVAATFLLATLAGTYAAIRAARLSPVEALRYE